jgi:hypothetical protein
MVRVRMTVARADENESGPVTGVSLRLATSALLLASAVGSSLWILYWDKPYPGPVLLLVVLSFVPKHVVKHNRHREAPLGSISGHSDLDRLC